jgi:acetate---CoA ligase (ADP-forming)
VASSGSFTNDPVDLEPLLEPRSVAVVGATDKHDSYGGNVLLNLERAGFTGPVWGVNPKRDEVHGRECVPTVADLPEPVDALVVAIPAAGVAEVVRAGAERGCRGAVVLSAGFAEVESGRAHQAELTRVAREYRLPVCGPNGNGVVVVGARAMLWGDGLPALDPGPVAMVTQSGNVGVNALGSRRGIRWHTVVSTGNQAVCTASDWVAAVAERDGVRSLALFLEDDDDGPALAEALAICAERGVGVAVLKVGASEAGARAASAHTGALAGDHRVFRALVEEAGAAWAEDFHDLLELSRVLAQPRARPRGSGGLAVLTCSGGDSGVAADGAAELGIELPELSATTRAQLAELLPDAATIGNPLDYTAIIWGETDLLARMVEIVGADPAIDQLLLLYDQPADADDSWSAVRAGLIAGARSTDAATLVASTLPDLLDHHAAMQFADDGVPAIAGLRSALRAARALRTPAGDPARLREVAAAARRACATSNGAGWLGEAEVKALLREAGVAVPDGDVVADAGAAEALADHLGYPVALKLSGSHLQHKSELGAIELGLNQAAEVREAFARLERLPVAAGASVLVERMAGPGAELLVAARADGIVPALVVGVGGIWTEALDDVAIVPLPAGPERVEDALRSLRAGPLLAGARGGAAADLAAVAELGARAGELLLDRGLTLLELNPVVAGSQGAIALDAVAR